MALRHELQNCRFVSPVKKPTNGVAFMLALESVDAALMRECVTSNTGKYGNFSSQSIYLNTKDAIRVTRAGMPWRVSIWLS